MKPTIEKNIPIPASKGTGRKPAFPELYSMAVGDCIEVPASEGMALLRAIVYAKAKSGLSFTYRSGPVVSRAWRIDPKE